MNAYNDLDGLPVVGSPEIMTDLLRGELGFEGCVVADYYSIDDLDGLHHIVADREEAARMALSAGIDVELPSAVYYATLADQVRSGRLDEAVVDQACRRVLEEKVALGLFDERYVGTEAAEGIETAEDLALARRAAARSIVLLTNDGTLPLAPGARVAVLGPSATDTRRLYGDYSYPGRSIHLGVDQVVADVVAPNDLRRIARRVPAPRQALAERFEVVDDLDGADVAVVFVGGQSGMSEEDTSGEFRDASDLRLPPEQLDLIEDDRGLGCAHGRRRGRRAGPFARRGRAPRRSPGDGVAPGRRGGPGPRRRALRRRRRRRSAPRVAAAHASARSGATPGTTTAAGEA